MKGRGRGGGFEAVEKRPIVPLGFLKNENKEMKDRREKEMKDRRGKEMKDRRVK